MATHEPGPNDPGPNEPKPNGTTGDRVVTAGLVNRLDDARRELGQYRSRYDELADRPDDLLAALRADRDFALAFIRADLYVHLGRWFPAREGGWEPAAGRSGAIGDIGVAVEWCYTGVHDGPELFNGLQPTGRTVVVRGVSVAGFEEDAPRAGRLDLPSRPRAVRVNRYVDWAGLFAQLGLSLNWRQPVPGRPPSR